jgi:hypothetical protein
MALGDANVGVRGSAAPPDQWIHLGATWDGETMALYVDGELAGTQSVPELLVDDHPVLIGADYDNPPDGYVGHFMGAIDDVRIYDRVLDPVELAALAQPP